MNAPAPARTAAGLIELTWGGGTVPANNVVVNRTAIRIATNLLNMMYVLL
jgi:hypothetical protein